VFFLSIYFEQIKVLTSLDMSERLYVIKFFYRFGYLKDLAIFKVNSFQQLPFTIITNKAEKTMAKNNYRWESSPFTFTLGRGARPSEREEQLPHLPVRPGTDQPCRPPSS
jgi:hypothetical protein